MTIGSHVTIVAPLRGTRAREHDRHFETLRFEGTYANVKRSGIAKTNQRLDADSVNRVTSPNSLTSAFLRKGASA